MAGLRAEEKHLPSKYFYDARGSKLFEQICQLDEYYLTRSELAIMQRFAPEMADQIGPGTMLIEYGSGSSVKTRLLLDALKDPVAYVPVDISRRHLQQSAEELSVVYPLIEVLPVCADFTADFDLPIPDRAPTHSEVYFPGSTIGNFQPPDAAMLLDHFATLCGTGGGLLIGIDLKKDVETIEAAYNDRQGVTAEFNLNLLRRINCELGADFALDQFRHQAIYDECDGRIEMYLISQCDQSVRIGDETFEFRRGEHVCTEYSHKYAMDEFEQIAAAAGLCLRHEWTDDRRFFAVLYFENRGARTVVD
jgi:dimethylhistidine N-methyltransferase